MNEGEGIYGVIASIRRKAVESIKQRTLLLLLISGVVITLPAILHQLLVMASWEVYGFSFDDSWIHVQYARTIFEGHPWEYSEGIPSTGSSAPLWSIILSPIFLFGTTRAAVVTSVLTISAILFVGNTVLAGFLAESQTNDWRAAIFAQVVFVLVPRNVGLMLSGMETPLAMMILLLILILLPKRDWRFDPLLGILAGLAYLCRPEFVLVAVLCFPIRALHVFYKEGFSIHRFISLSSMFIIALLTVAPWVLHCLNVTGLPLPDSYYSKMRWGVSSDAVNLWNFFWLRVWLPSEPFLILGFIGAIILAFKRRPYEGVLIAGMVILYRLTMPGMALLFAARYLVPLFNLLALSFAGGTSILFSEIILKVIPEENMKPNEEGIIAILLLSVLFIPSVISYNHHVQIHANQASNIQEMQVTLSLWIRENIPANSTIATYDVGAIGYFARGRVIDLYGLVTPEILHNRTSIEQRVTYLREINCTYIMFYVQWFAGLRFGISRQNGTITELTRAHLDDNVVCGTDDMAVYRITW
jgi:hypothetical protein